MCIYYAKLCMGYQHQNINMLSFYKKRIPFCDQVCMITYQLLYVSVYGLRLLWKNKKIKYIILCLTFDDNDRVAQSIKSEFGVI